MRPPIIPLTEAREQRLEKTDLAPRMHARLSSLAAACIVVGCLVPFLGKAFHVDDPLFLWTARQIIEKPGDFFGTTVNWLGTESRCIRSRSTLRSPAITPRW